MAFDQGNMVFQFNNKWIPLHKSSDPVVSVDEFESVWIIQT